MPPSTTLLPAEGQYYTISLETMKAKTATPVMLHTITGVPRQTTVMDIINGRYTIKYYFEVAATII